MFYLLITCISFLLIYLFICVSIIYLFIYLHIWDAELAQYSVWLQTGRPGFAPQQRQRTCPSNLCVQTSSEAHPASYPMGTAEPFAGGKAQPGRDADHSHPSSAEVKNE
jgi:hypothetical protein